jgi:ribosomal protein S18 acetylase RimI-like enzyme
MLTKRNQEHQAPALGDVVAAGRHTRSWLTPVGIGGRQVAVTGIRVLPMSLEHVEGFHLALDEVCRERKYLARVQAPSIQTTRAWVLDNIKKGVPQFVGLDGRKVVGWCDISPSDKEAFCHTGVMGMGVLMPYRHQGVGRRLLAAALARAREMGLERVELEVFESNDAAIALYLSLGFQREGRKVRACKIDGRYDNSLVMALLL